MRISIISLSHVSLHVVVIATCLPLVVIVSCSHLFFISFYNHLFASCYSTTLMLFVLIVTRCNCILLWYRPEHDVKLFLSLVNCAKPLQMKYFCMYVCLV